MSALATIPALSAKSNHISALVGKHSTEVCRIVWDRLSKPDVPWGRSEVHDKDLLATFHNCRHLMVEAWQSSKSDPVGSMNKLCEASKCNSEFPESASKHKFEVSITPEIALLAMEILAPVDLAEWRLINVCKEYSKEIDEKQGAYSSARCSVFAADHRVRYPHRRIAGDPTDFESLCKEYKKRELETEQELEETINIYKYARELQETISKLNCLLKPPTTDSIPAGTKHVSTGTQTDV